MAYLVGALFAVDLFWIFGFLVLRILKDVPLGPVDLRAKGDDYRASVEKNLAAQQRLFSLWRNWLIWIAVASFIAAVAIMVTSG